MERAVLASDDALIVDQAAAMLDYIEARETWQHEAQRRDALAVCDMCMFALWALALPLCAAGLFL